MSILFGDVMREGLNLFFFFLGKVFFLVGIVLIVVELVGFMRILVEMEVLRVLRVFIFIFVFIYCYFDFFVEEIIRMKWVFDFRVFGVGRVEYYRKFVFFFGEVFVRVYLRSGRVYRVMFVRGFGEFLVFEELRLIFGMVVLMVFVVGGLIL